METGLITVNSSEEIGSGRGREGPATPEITVAELRRVGGCGEGGLVFRMIRLALKSF